MDKPTYELKAFAKTALLQPGKTQKLIFTIAPEDLTSFNTNKSSWIADAGSYTVNIGASSLQIKQTVTFKLDKDVVVEKVKPVLTPKVEITEIR